MPSVAYMQVLNKLHGQRFKLEQSLKKLQECMNVLEKERAWQGHADELSLPLQRHQAVVRASVCDAISLMILASRKYADLSKFAFLTDHRQESKLVVIVC